MVTLNEQDVVNVMNGAGLLASGGGGAVKDGLVLLNTFKVNNPTVPIKVELISADEMDADKYSAIVAGLGAPTSLAGQDFTPCATGAYEEISSIAIGMGKEVAYTMPVELGGFNTFVPMLITLVGGNPIVDADGAGRAVPGLETLLTNVNGFATSPVSLSDTNDNRIQIRTKDPENAMLTQSIAGTIAAQNFNGIAGIAGWILSKDNIRNGIPTGTITLAKHIGELMQQLVAEKGEREYVDDLYEAIQNAGYARARALSEPVKITNYSQSVNNGFDVGNYYVGSYRIYFQNESIVLYSVAEDGTETPYMTAPDIITLYNARTAEPVTNEDIDHLYKAGTLDEIDVVPGVIKVDANWWLNEEKTMAVWKGYFESVGYNGEIIRYNEL